MVQTRDPDKKIPLTPAMARVRDAYTGLASQPGDLVDMADLRAAADLPADEFKTAVKNLVHVRGVTVEEQTNQKTLSARDRAAAVHIGGRDQHLVGISPNFGTSPAAVDRSDDAATDWSRYRTCTICFAQAGRPCHDLGRVGSYNAHPHPGRPEDGEAPRESRHAPEKMAEPPARAIRDSGDDKPTERTRGAGMRGLRAAMADDADDGQPTTFLERARNAVAGTDAEKTGAVPTGADPTDAVLARYAKSQGWEDKLDDEGKQAAARARQDNIDRARDAADRAASAAEHTHPCPATRNGHMNRSNRTSAGPTPTGPTSRSRRPPGKRSPVTRGPPPVTSAPPRSGRSAPSTGTTRTSTTSKATLPNPGRRCSSTGPVPGGTATPTGRRSSAGPVSSPPPSPSTGPATPAPTGRPTTGAGSAVLPPAPRATTFPTPVP
jgi:hypothetical protein